MPCTHARLVGFVWGVKQLVLLGLGLGGFDGAELREGFGFRGVGAEHFAAAAVGYEELAIASLDHDVHRLFSLDGPDAIPACLHDFCMGTLQVYPSKRIAYAFLRF